MTTCSTRTARDRPGDLQVWRLPLFESYRKQLASKISDLKNVSSGGLGGAIIAALYLDEFVGVAPPSAAATSSAGSPTASPTVADKPPFKKPVWIHLDHMAYNQVSGVCCTSSLTAVMVCSAVLLLTAPGPTHAHSQASKPGRPEGGEAQGMRALFALLAERYGKPAHYPL